MSSSSERMSDNGEDWKVGTITEEASEIDNMLPRNTATCGTKLVMTVKGAVTTIFWSVMRVTLRSSIEEPAIFFSIDVVGEGGLLKQHSIPDNWDHARFRLEMFLSPPNHAVATMSITGRQRLTSVIWQHGDPGKVGRERHWVCNYCVDERRRYNSNSGSNFVGRWGSSVTVAKEDAENWKESILHLGTFKQGGEIMPYYSQWELETKEQK
ncbi:hypothetical protein BZA05DRAFT_445633 [Tricharina praecox]|uniref:uncharacterized protein n=1 Tax=Tricharina praecox TaxID=43433 RepID=UPI00221F1430|nr:uncharacterized protein BZA05DRAFT_445633 [Tricharina praecox]KAI5850795.1 hypothetical protein BZA05DRAFT_445633 [Tricharina praecox]